MFLIVSLLYWYLIQQKTHRRFFSKMVVGLFVKRQISYLAKESFYVNGWVYKNNQPLLAIETETALSK